MKGQFMIISAIIIGVIVISVASIVDQTQRTTYNNPATAYKVEMVKSEAQKIDINVPKERENFGRMTEMMDAYSVNTKYWGSQQCFNVTLTRTDRRLRLECIG